jgi:integration host factor subunit beta
MKDNGVTKRELVVEIAEKLGYTQNEVASIVQASLDTITTSLTEGQRLEIRNFGVFEVKARDARMGRNPRTGDEVPINRKRVATFKPGKALKELVQNHVPEPVREETSPVIQERTEVPPTTPETPPREPEGGGSGLAF